MDFSEIQERYLRPHALADNLDHSTWSDETKVWVRMEEATAAGSDDDSNALPLFVPGTVLKQGSPGSIQVRIFNGQVMQVPAGRVHATNAARYDRYEDMAQMGELNEACVLDIMKNRYASNLIYTFSGLFLVAVNPYKQVPIYGDEVIRWYRGQKRTERPPHIFSLADGAYQALLATGKSQSILITGESGAGKTENTKKVIQYLTSISTAASSAENHDLERQLILANTLLESFGNAQTIRNNNSSRFGKFIRIEIDTSSGQIIGASIEKYLLEKSRVTHRAEGERSFHVFYQLLAGADDALLEELKLKQSAKRPVAADFAYLAKSNTAVANVNDASDMAQLQEAFRVIGMSKTEERSVFRILAGILLLGQLEIAEQESSGQAYLPAANDCLLADICELLGVEVQEFASALLNPEIRAGREVVQQAREREQVERSLEALSRSLYERLFDWLVDRLNARLFHAPKTTSSSARPFIGVLDIAGFEIFGVNSLEQLLINYTNERLQQFFNHHMFVVEQAEYRREGLAWEFVDFGLDAQPMIDLLEAVNPVGVLACLDEDCVMPKATDRSFTSKLASLIGAQHTTSASKFSTDRFTADTHFTLNHYAGKVTYSTSNWLEKNKDPLNEAVARLLARSATGITAALFAEYSSGTGALDADSKRQKNQRAGIFRTVAQRHRESLVALMAQLAATQPHFVRCIVPNTTKTAGLFQDRLVHEQLHCNGVLEGIRICRQGFPNRLRYADFWRLYSILDAKDALLPELSKPANANDPGHVRGFLKDLLGWTEGNDYALGSGKLFFRAGRLGRLDARRDALLAQTLRALQAACRGALVRAAQERAALQAQASAVLAESVRSYLKLRAWPWWRLLMRVRPFLTVSRADMKIKDLSQQLELLHQEHSRQEAEYQEAKAAQRAQIEGYDQKVRSLDDQMARLQDALSLATVQETDLRQKLDGLQNELVIANAERSRLERELADRETELQTTKEQLEGEMTQRLQALSIQKDGLEAKLVEAASQQKSLAEQLQLAESQAQEEGSKLRDQVAQWEAELKESKAQGEALRLEHFEAGKLLEQSGASCRQLEELLAGKTDEVSDLMNVLRERESRVIDLESRVAEQEAELHDLKLEQEELQGQLLAREKDISDASDQRTKLNAKIGELEESIQEREETIRGLSRQKEELSRQLTDLQTELDSKDAHFAKQRLDFESKLERLRADAKAQMEKSLAEQQTQSDLETKAKLATQSEELKEQNRRQLEEQVTASDAQLRQRLAEQRAAVEAEAAGRLAIVQSELDLLNETHAAMQLDLQTIKAEVEERETRILGLERQLNEATQRYRELNEDTASRQSAFSSQLEALRSQLSEAESMCQGLKDTLASKELQCNQLDGEMKRAQQTARRERDRLEAQLKDAARRRDEALEREEALLHEQREAGDKLNQERIVLRAAQDRESQVEGELKNVQGKLKLVTEQLEASRLQHSTDSQALNELKERVNELEAELEGLHDTECVQAEQLRCNEQVRSLLQAELSESQSHARRLQMDKSGLQAQLDQALAALKHSSPLNGSASSLATTATSALDDVLARLEADSRDRQALVQENRRLERNVKDLNDRLTDTTSTLSQVQAALKDRDEGHLQLVARCEEFEVASEAADRTVKRLERALADEKERSDRLARDLERWRGTTGRSMNAAGGGLERTGSTSSIASRLTDRTINLKAPLLEESQ